MDQKETIRSVHTHRLSFLVRQHNLHFTSVALDIWNRPVIAEGTSRKGTYPSPGRPAVPAKIQLYAGYRIDGLMGGPRDRTG